MSLHTKFGNISTSLSPSVITEIEDAIESATATSVKHTAASTNNAIVRFDGVSGLAVKNSNITIDDLNNLNTSGAITAEGVKPQFVEYTKLASQTASAVGNLKVYANTDGLLHHVDELGVDTVINGETSNQPLNTFNDVEFKSVAIENWNMTQDGNNDFQLLNNDSKLLFGGHTAGIPSTLCAFLSKNSGAAGGFRSYRSRGSLDIPTAVNNNDTLDVRRIFAHDGINYRDCGAIYIKANGSHTASNSGTFVGMDLTPAGTKNINVYYQFKTNAFNIGQPGIGYTLPTTRGLLNQVLKTDASGFVTWADDNHSFNQELNTTNNVSFNSITSQGKVTVGAFVPATSWQLTNIRGTNGQVLKTTGSQSYWAPSVSEDVRYISSPLYGNTDITGLVTINPLAGGAIQNSDSANQGPNASVSPSSYGFTFNLTENTKITSIGINGNHIGFAAGPRAFRIYRDSDQAIMLDSTIANTDTVISGRYVKSVSVILAAGAYRVGITLIAGDSRSISDQSATLNVNLGVVRGCFGAIDAYPSNLLGIGFVAAGYLDFQQPPEIDAELSVENIVTNNIDVNGSLTIGANQDINDYIMPLTRGGYGTVLRSGLNGATSWSPNGAYSQNGAFVTVSNTNLKTSIVGTGVGSLEIPVFGAGCTYHLKIAGSIEDESKDEELKIIVDIGGITVYESQFFDLEEVKTEQVWETEIDIVCRTTGVAGVFHANGQFIYSRNGGANDFRGFNTQFDSVVNTTISNTINVSAQWTNASAGNIFICKMLNVIKTF